MVPESQGTGIVLPYEKAAMRGDPMPEGLKSYDITMFQNLSLLYERYRRKMIDRDQATREKKSLLEAYRIDKWGDEVIQSMVDLWKRIEGASAAYCMNPSVETADKLYEALYRAKRGERMGHEPGRFPQRR